MKQDNTPILVANTKWLLPESLIKDVKAERMVNSLIDFACPLEKEEQVGWAECIAYLMPATQESVLRSNVVDIYLYCVNKLMERKGIKDLDFLERHKELSEYNMQKLKEFKLWIYEHRGGREQNSMIDVLREVFK